LQLFALDVAEKGRLREHFQLNVNIGEASVTYRLADYWQWQSCMDWRIILGQVSDRPACAAALGRGSQEERGEHSRPSTKPGAKTADVTQWSRKR